MMRAKLRITNVKKRNDTCEELSFSAVCKNDGYGDDGLDENNTYAKFTPTAELNMQILNPALIGKFTVGQEFYVDFTPASN